MATGRAIEVEVEVVRRPRRPFLSTRARGPIALAAGTLLLAALVWAAFSVDTIQSAYASLTGQVISVDATTKSFGVVAPGDPIALTFHLTNRGSKPIRLVGCLAYCNCITPPELPYTIAAGETSDFAVAMTNPDREGQNRDQTIDQPLVLYAANPAQPEISLRITGEIRVNPASATPVP